MPREQERRAAVEAEDVALAQSQKKKEGELIETEGSRVQASTSVDGRDHANSCAYLQSRNAATAAGETEAERQRRWTKE